MQLKTPLTKVFLKILVACAVQLAVATSGQNIFAQSALSEIEQIDQILKDNRTLLAQARFDEILPPAEKALALSLKLGDKGREARARLQIATAAFHLGEKPQAIDNFKQAADIAAQAGDRNLQALALNSAATLMTSSGMYDDAYFFYSQSRILNQQVNNLSGEAFVLASMTALFMDTDRLGEAEQMLQEALRLMQQLKAQGKSNQSVEDLILFRLAGLELIRNRPAVALNYAQKLLAGVTEKTFSGMRLEAQDRLGDIYSHLGEYDKALAVYTENLLLTHKLKSTSFEGRTLGSLAKLHHRAGKSEEALLLILQAIPLARATQNWMLEREFLIVLAEIQSAIGHRAESLEVYQQAMKANAQLRWRSLPSEEAKGAIVSNGERIYVGAIEMLFELKRAEEALEVAEAWHAGAFLDVLAEARIDLRRDLTREQKIHEDKLLEKLAQIQKELWAPQLPSTHAATLKTEMQRVESQLELMQIELRRANPRYASVKYPQPLKPANIAGELLDADTALIEYVLSEKRSFAWVVRSGKITAVTLPAKNVITEQITNYRAALNEKVSALNVTQSTAKLNAIGQQLYQSLVRPLEPALTNARKLIIVPDSALVYLPFETLVKNAAAQKTEYLLERFAISYAPSATVLATLKNIAADANRKTNGVIAFGDPIYNVTPEKTTSSTLAFNATRTFDLRSLPYTRREIIEIAALFPKTEQQTFLGTEAHEQNVKAARLDQFRYVHFAAHGVVDENFPARSGIVLSATANSLDDGVLQMSEVMRLKFNANLVTLSACRTGLGKLLNGEGMLGLTRAFLYAGAESVAVSLWDVNDMATASLMKSFYQNLQKGLPKDQALRQAKLTMLKSTQRTWQHPYYWAPFVLIGNSQ